MTPALLTTLLTSVGIPILTAIIGRYSHLVVPVTTPASAPAAAPAQGIDWSSLLTALINTLVVQPATPATSPALSGPVTTTPASPTLHPLANRLLTLLAGLGQGALQQQPAAPALPAPAMTAPATPKP